MRWPLAYRVLIVEDHVWWRRHIAQELERTSQWEVVGAVSDGLEAVQEAHDLKPDIILLDIGLPGLDGIQAARRILADDPSSRILFVTEQQSLDIAEMALSIGARGFIMKSDVGRDLLPAMGAVVQGGRFISAKMAGRGCATASDGRDTQTSRRHEAVFYADESSLMDDYAKFVEASLKAGNGLVVVLTRPRREQLQQRLLARGIDLDRAIAEKRSVWMDVSVILSSCMVDGRIDQSRCRNAATSLIMEAARGSTRPIPRVSAFGEGASTLLQQGLPELAIQLEQLWDEVARTFDVDIFCPYVGHGLRCDEESAVFRDLCAAHSGVHVR